MNGEGKTNPSFLFSFSFHLPKNHRYIHLFVIKFKINRQILKGDFIMDFFNPDTVIEDCLETAFKLKTYMEIMDRVKSADFKNDTEFRKMYNGFYRVRQRSSAWYDLYFSTMQQQITENLSFKEILHIMFKEGNQIEVSFVSKLMATINPQLPIWDKYVLKNLGKASEWKRFSSYDPIKRIEKADDIYKAIDEEYKSFMEEDEGKLCIAKFDMALPKYKDKLTDVRKIDFMLWSKQ